MGKCSIIDALNNKESICNILTKLAYIILFFFPFSIATIYGLVNYFIDWTWLLDGHNKEFYSQSDFLYKGMAFWALTAIILIVAKIIKLFSFCYKAYTDKRRIFSGKVVTIVIIFATTVIIRIILLYIYYGKIQPFSDFKWAWDIANGDMSSLPKHLLFPAWMNYSLIEKIISCVTDANYTAVLVFGIVCNGVTNIFIFLITNVIFQKYELSVLASIFYLLNPSLIVYALISTPEHLAIACFTCSVYFVCKYYDAKNILIRLFFLLIAGIIGGIGSSVKTFFPIIIVAFMITLILGELRKRDVKKIGAIIFVFFSVIFLFIMQELVVNGITSMSEKVFDVDLDFADAAPHFLSVGLNRQGEGQLGGGRLAVLYRTDRMDGLSSKEAKAHAIKEIVNDWKGNINDVPKLFVTKTIWAWQDNYIPIKFLLLNSDIKCDTSIEKATYKIIATIGATFSQLWYILMMFLGMIGVACILRKKNTDIKNLKFLFSNLIILGYFFLIILSEAQSRYKCLILPFLCIIDAYTVLQIFEIVKGKNIKREFY